MSRYAYYFIPSILVVGIWLSYMILTENFHLIANHWQFSLTMVLGGFMSGATSEGSGAITFPIFTKVLGVEPAIARNFAWIMQSVGMGTASILILKYKIPFVKIAVFLPAITGVLGMILSSHFIQPLILPAYAKITFTMVTFSFGLVLFFENRAKDVHRIENIVDVRFKDFLILACGGLVGGIVFGIVGTGLDLIVFAILVNYYQVSEKVATPTSVVLQAIACFSTVIYHALFFNAYRPGSAVLDYWLACIPASAIMAPVGALVAARISRKQVTNVLLGLILIEFISTLWIVKFDRNAMIFAPTLAITLILAFTLLRKIGHSGNKFPE